jgi:NhaC family Na+:H+ antiporter
MSFLQFAKGTGSLIATSVLSAIFVNIVTADQYLSVILPGRMYKAEFVRRGIKPKNLARACEDGGTVTSVLIPWNTCGAFVSSALGVPVVAFLPYCIFNLSAPIISMVLGFTGISIEKIPPEEHAAMAEKFIQSLEQQTGYSPLFGLYPVLLL